MPDKNFGVHMENQLYYEFTAKVPATATELFAYMDDPRRLGAHMSQSSWMMMGSTMNYQFDAAQGRAMDSHIQLSGRLLGLPLHVDEVITRRDIPVGKTWHTVGSPRLLIIGEYEMGFEIKPAGPACMLRIYISYHLPQGPTWLLGWLLGGIYARWCVKRMVSDAQRHFVSTAPPV